MASELRVALCTMAKNEEDYLQEWVDYHTKLGFCAVHVYESGGWRCHNDSVIAEPVSADMSQEAAFNKFIADYRDRYDWVLFSDVDEYVVLANGDDDIREFLARYGQTPYLYMNWRMFGNNHQLYNGDNSLVDRFTLCAKELSPLGKTFYNLNAGESPMASAHAVADNEDECNLIGEYMSDSKCSWSGLDGCIKIGYLAHYRSKTWPEWCRKMDTNCGLYFPFSQLKNRKNEYTMLNGPGTYAVEDLKAYSFKHKGSFITKE